MEKSILNFPKQFTFRPKIENAKNLKPAENFIVAGMGGSALGAEIIKSALPELNLVTWRDYGLPSIPYTPNPKPLVICSSYSGNTEETISAFEKARKLKLNLAAVTVGGKLLALAKKSRIPYVKIPNTGIQPRVALGFNSIALLKILGKDSEIKKTFALSKTLNPPLAEKEGRALAEKLWDKVPIIYASSRNLAIAYNWKIKFNETGKIPAFYNVFSELNHNEMTGFDAIKTTRALSQNFHFIFIKDSTDSAKIQKRMAITKQLYENRGLPVELIELKGKNVWQRIFQNLLVADWTAISLARYYGAETTEVPMVEEFKKLIK